MAFVCFLLFRAVACCSFRGFGISSSLPRSSGRWLIHPRPGCCGNKTKPGGMKQNHLPASLAFSADATDGSPFRRGTLSLREAPLLSRRCTLSPFPWKRRVHSACQLPHPTTSEPRARRNATLRVPARPALPGVARTPKFGGIWISY